MVIHPYMYRVEIHDEVTIKAGYLGVQVRKVGEIPSGDPVLVEEGNRGIQKRPLEPGKYYLNPYVVEVVPISIRTQRYYIASGTFHDVAMKTVLGRIVGPGEPVCSDYQVIRVHYIRWVVGPVDGVRRLAAVPAQRDLGRSWAARDRERRVLEGQLEELRPTC